MRPADAVEALRAARGLAAVRIVACSVVLLSADVHGAVASAAFPAPADAYSPGLAYLASFALDPRSAAVARLVVVFAASLGILGVYARAACGLLALALLPLLATPARFGSVVHAHHLLYAAALLAASPCADAFAVDARLAPRPLRPAATYEGGLFAFRLVVSALYFFPGLHKALAFARGVDPGAWFVSHLEAKWVQLGTATVSPAAAGFVERPAVASAAALAAVAFELAMPWLALGKHRRLGLSAAATFHVATAALLGIRFESLAAVLVSLAPGGGTSARDAWRAATRATRASALVLAAGLGGFGVAGVTEGYPFACYPTFARPAPRELPSFVARVVGRTPCASERPRGNASWSTHFHLARPGTDAAAYRAFARRELAGRCAATAGDTVEVVRVANRWDRARARARTDERQRVYVASASSLGLAPAEGTSASSAPPR